MGLKSNKQKNNDSGRQTSDIMQQLNAGLSTSKSKPTTNDKEFYQHQLTRISKKLDTAFDNFNKASSEFFQHIIEIKDKQTAAEIQDELSEIHTTRETSSSATQHLNAAKNQIESAKNELLNITNAISAYYYSLKNTALTQEKSEVAKLAKQASQAIVKTENDYHNTVTVNVHRAEKLLQLKVDSLHQHAEAKAVSSVTKSNSALFKNSNDAPTQSHQPNIPKPLSSDLAAVAEAVK